MPVCAYVTACGRGYGEKKKAEVIVTLERSPRACFGKQVKNRTHKRPIIHIGTGKARRFCEVCGAEMQLEYVRTFRKFA